ncbi:MAG TPA: hypothetical protein VHL98_22255 [Microvirga sp.]|nr:hypothetical protein [Microvirga sp.]
MLDHPPLDNRLYDTTLGDAAFHDTALDHAILIVVLDHHMATGAGQIVFILLDHAALYTRAVEVVIAIHQGIPAPDLSLSRRRSYQGCAAEH